MDRPEGESLHKYNPVYDDPPVANHISYAIGIAIGRFGANGEGIHRWADNALQILLADHLIPEMNRIEGELQDLNESRRQGEKKARANAEKRYNWSELCNAKGRKDYDWSHLAARYFPGRVDEKCRKDPSLGVAHGCFWKYHSEKAYQWELRLQDEIEAGFRIDEKGSDALRADFEEGRPDEVKALIEAENKRREKKEKKKYSPQRTQRSQRKNKKKYEYRFAREGIGA